MGTMSFAQVPPTAATIALNAYIFGYGGHSLVTPHAALKQLWWTDDRIETKVTRKFVVSQIKGEERDFLDRPLAFGEGLTDDTYMEWILSRARRLFIILAELGKSEQIFGLIDDSMDDDDLPFSLESIERLELSIEPDDRLNRNFYATQFLYLLRQLREGGHIDYGPQEHIPMEFVHKIPPAVSLQNWDRIHFPNEPQQVFLRRKFNIGAGEDKDELKAAYLKDVAEAKRLKHPHIARAWASYTSGDAGYVLSDFVPEHTLSSFIAHRTPYQFMCVSQNERPVILLEWMHCLANALAMLHHRGVHHGAIRPSNILVDHDNCIAFADIGSLGTFQRGKKVSKNETTDYAVPETNLDQTARVHFPDTITSGKRSSAGSALNGNPMFSGSSPPEISSPVLISSSSPMSPVDSPTSGAFSSPANPLPIPLFRNFSRHLPSPPTIAFASRRLTSPRMSGGASHGPATPPTSPVHLRQFSWDVGRPQFSPPDPVRPLPLKPSRASDPGRFPYVSVVDPERSKYSSVDPAWSRSWLLYTGSSPRSPVGPQPLSPHVERTKDPSDSSSSTSSSTPLPTPAVPSNTPTLPGPPDGPPTPPHPLSTHKDTCRTVRPATARESDIFSLGCVYLDLVTFVVKGKLGSLHKFRSSNPELQSDPSTLHTWLAHLASDAQRLAPGIPILAALPPILGVVRDMLAPNPDFRPDVMAVKQRVAAALELAGVEACCKDRSWDDGGHRRPRGSAAGEGTADADGGGVGLAVRDGEDGKEGQGQGQGEGDVTTKRAWSEGPAGGNKVGRMKKLGIPWRKASGGRGG